MWWNIITAITFFTVWNNYSCGTIALMVFIWWSIMVTKKKKKKKDYKQLGTLVHLYFISIPMEKNITIFIPNRILNKQYTNFVPQRKKYYEIVYNILSNGTYIMQNKHRFTALHFIQLLKQNRKNIPKIYFLKKCAAPCFRSVYISSKTSRLLLHFDSIHCYKRQAIQYTTHISWSL